ncbi:MAG: pyridoxal-phosphate dependent enzyme [Anaerolinea sp.]|nr:pyridoxal-phosphate dependent enzyme [Anaerolinea sp.]
MTTYLTHLVCLECEFEFAPDVMAAACPRCGSGWLDARYDYAAVAPRWRDGLAGVTDSLWRYADLLPLDAPDPEISLNEGRTPLIRLYQYERMYQHPHLYVKDERQSPTSSFKDRQAAVAVTALKRAGITECVLASTGNAASAYAAYCARAGIKLWLFMSSLVSSEKMREAGLYGAEVVKVSGTYDETKHVAAEFAKRRGIHLDRGAKAIPGKESMKTLGFEIAEQLAGQFADGQGRWRAPDWYLQAVSGGIGPLGVWKGFLELYKMGLIDRLPKLGIIQAAGCAPMVTAFKAGKAQADPVVPKTLITVLATGDPGFSYEQLRAAVLQTGGTMRAIEDGETFAAMRKIASKAGLSVEPATAVAFAGLEQLLSDGTIQQDEVVVVNCSGHTFPAESHVLGDQFLHSLELEGKTEGLGAAFSQLDEQVTTILVVDDNPNDRRLIRRMLTTRKQYRVFEAQDGADALRVIGEQAPNLIVTDLTMPGMDGFTLLERLKADARTAAIPVVVLSAKSLDAADKDLLERFSESVWTKGDFETRALVDHIVTALKNESS